MVIIKYWLYSLCFTVYPCSLFILVCSSLDLLISYPILSLPPFLSPLVTISLFSVPVSLFLFCYIHQSVLFLFFRFYISVVSYSIGVFVWLTSPSIILSQSIHVVVILEILINATRQEKTIRGIRIENEKIKISLFIDNMIVQLENSKVLMTNLMQAKQFYKKYIQLHNFR